MSNKISRVWHDGHHLKLAIGCVRKVQPVRWSEVLDELRKSRGYRRSFLSHARGMSAFIMLCILSGVRP